MLRVKAAFVDISPDISVNMVIFPIIHVQIKGYCLWNLIRFSRGLTNAYIVDFMLRVKATVWESSPDFPVNFPVLPLHTMANEYRNDSSSQYLFNINVLHIKEFSFTNRNTVLLPKNT